MSKLSLTTKILALTDALGNLVRFDKAFDANWIIAGLNERGAKIVISQRPKRKAPLDIDRDVYKWRHLIVMAPGNLPFEPHVDRRPVHAHEGRTTTAASNQRRSSDEETSAAP